VALVSRPPKRSTPPHLRSGCSNFLYTSRPRRSWVAESKSNEGVGPRSSVLWSSNYLTLTQMLQLEHFFNGKTAPRLMLVEAV
jgi:hypothetical protein